VYTLYLHDDIFTTRSELPNVLFLTPSSKVEVTMDKNGIFAALSAACVRFIFGKTC